MRIIFMGSPNFACPSLTALVGESNFEVVAVYTQVPRPKNRGHQVHLTPVHELAKTYGLPVYTPVNFKDPKDLETIAFYKPDAIVVVAYGLLLPKVLLQIPRLGCINIHASLLPRWRGAAPIQRCIEAGDHETGITIMQMDQGLDTGAILAAVTCSIGVNTTTPGLHDKLSILGADLLVKTLKNPPSPIAQPIEGSCYAKKLTKEEGVLDYHESVEVLERRIRAFTPWPGTWVFYKSKILKVLKATIVSLPPDAILGTWINPLTLVCQGGGLQLDLVRLPGSKPMTGEDFYNGFRHK